jgi:hypothetical protein
MIDWRVFSAPNSEGRCTVVEDDDTLVICKSMMPCASCSLVAAIWRGANSHLVQRVSRAMAEHLGAVSSNLVGRAFTARPVRLVRRRLILAVIRMAPGLAIGTSRNLRDHRRSSAHTLGLWRRRLAGAFSRAWQVALPYSSTRVTRWTLKAVSYAAREVCTCS